MKHVVRIGGFHGRDDGFYTMPFPGPTSFSEGQSYFRGIDPRKTGAGPFLVPDEWLTEGSALPIADAKLKIFLTSKPPKALCLIERHGGILITGDTLQHAPKPDEFYNFLAKIMMKRMGFMKPYNVGPGWLQFAHPTVADVRSILDLEFEHVLPGHGDAVIGGAKEKYRPAIDGELKGCRS